MKSLADRIVDLALKVQQIPAPTFEEINRSRFILNCFENEHLSDITMDNLGNVYARLTGKDSSLPPLVVSAHLDTVFPYETPLDIKKNGNQIFGPGLGDNSLAVAGLVGLTWLLRERGIQLPGDLWLVANIAEEGLGDLKGMKAVVERFGDSTSAYLILEGTALGQVYHRALRVRRYRITFSAEGGHSWAHFGRPSAIHKAAEFITALSDFHYPKNPRTSYNVGLITGGTSINTIAAHTSIDLDLRSEKNETLEKVISQVTGLVHKMNSQEIEIKMEIIGDRPGGELPADHPIVKLAVHSLIRRGIEPNLRIGSTDANIPLSKGLQAVCIGITLGGAAHSMKEFILTEPIDTGLEHLLDMVTGIWDLPKHKL